MTDEKDTEVTRYFNDSQSWADDREQAAAQDRRLGWLVAACTGTIALLEGIALIILMPLKTVEPYTLLVDRETGYVEALKPLERDTIAPDRALIRSFLAQYVIAREEFDIDSLRESYRKVALWSAGDARSQYLAGMQANNPDSPLANLPRRSLAHVEIHSISPLGADRALVRFATIRTDAGGQPQTHMLWSVVLNYRFSGAAMSAADRLTNPLGFQVTHYHRDADIVPESATLADPTVPAGQIRPIALSQPIGGAMR